MCGLVRVWLDSLWCPFKPALIALASGQEHACFRTSLQPCSSHLFPWTLLLWSLSREGEGLRGWCRGRSRHRRRVAGPGCSGLQVPSEGPGGGGADLAGLHLGRVDGCGQTCTWAARTQGQRDRLLTIPGPRCQVSESQACILQGLGNRQSGEAPSEPRIPARTALGSPVTPEGLMLGSGLIRASLLPSMEKSRNMETSYH